MRFSDKVLLGAIIVALPVAGLIMGLVCAYKVVVHPRPVD